MDLVVVSSTENDQIVPADVVEIPVAAMVDIEIMLGTADLALRKKLQHDPTNKFPMLRFEVDVPVVITTVIDPVSHMNMMRKTGCFAIAFSKGRRISDGMRFLQVVLAILALSCCAIHLLLGQEAEEPVKTEEKAAPVEATNAIAHTKQKLQSVIAKEATNSPAKPRLPVYVLPEVIEVRIPGGMRFIFVEQHHMQELAKKFPAIRYTNIIVYADGL